MSDPHRKEYDGIISRDNGGIEARRLRKWATLGLLGIALSLILGASVCSRRILNNYQANQTANAAQVTLTSAAGEFYNQLGYPATETNAANQFFTQLTAQATSTP